MKLKRRLKNVSDVTRAPIIPTPRTSKFAPNRVQDAVSYMATAEALIESYEAKREAEHAESIASPERAAKVGRGYAGPEMPDKGKKNGSCNRTACQMPLAGKPQFWMKDHMVKDGRLYYCRACERMFTRADREYRDELRCQPDEDNHLYERQRG